MAMTPKLTEAQVKALRGWDVAGGFKSARWIGCMSNTMAVLLGDGLLENSGNRTYRITPAGRAALAAIDGVTP